MTRKITLFLILLVFCGTALFAQGENLTLKVAVIGPGKELYFWWGHIGLIIEDSNGRSRFYDYGIFDFDQDDFFYNFVFGRLNFRCGVSPTARNYEVYRYTNRDIIVYTLDNNVISPQKRQEILEFSEKNLLENDGYYRYHHFDDNCSTRIRDVIDIATDGQFKEQYGQMQSQFTLRQHVRRHTWFSPPTDWLLNFLMGQVIDTPITVWDDMFLPSEVGKRLNEFYFTDENGEKKKLISEDPDPVYTATGRPAVLDAPRKQWPMQLAFSVFLSLIFGVFFFLYSKNIAAGRVLAGLSMCICGLFFGFTGTMNYFFSLFTDHDYAYQNMNMLFCTPLLLAAVPAGIRYAFTKNEQKLFVSDQLLRLVWLLSAAGVLVSMLIKLLPWFYQDNLTDQLLVLPIALVFVLQPVGLKKTLKKWRLHGR